MDTHTDVELRLSVTEIPGAAPRTATLRCQGGRAVAGGYLADAPAEACRHARRLARFLLSEPDPDRVCTEIFGGPQTGEVTGVIDGRRVRRSFSRRNGCEIADWDRMGLLLDAAITPARLLVAFHRTGGIAGFDDRLSVARSGLATHTPRGSVARVFRVPAADLSELRDALAAADFPALDDEYLPEVPVADAFTYTLTHVGRTVVTSDGAIPPELEAPIALLTGLLVASSVAPFA
jgi:hypothetical protein